MAYVGSLQKSLETYAEINKSMVETATKGIGRLVAFGRLREKRITRAIDLLNFVLYLFTNAENRRPPHKNRLTSACRDRRGDDQPYCLEVLQMGIAQRAKWLRTSRNSASIRTFSPAAAIKCGGAAVFRSQAARDAACLLDVNPSVISWHCMPISLDCEGTLHVPDFGVVNNDGGRMLIDAPDRVLPIEAGRIETSAEQEGFRYRRLLSDEVYDGPRLRNVKDLLRYGNCDLALGDRLRLLATLDEHGSLTMAECLTVFTETKPVAAIAQMILSGFVEVDLDTELLGPQTMVRRIRV